MRRSWNIATGLLLLCLVAFTHPVEAATKKKPSQPAAPKKSKSAASKSATSKSAKSSKSSATGKKQPVPSRPPADIPVVTEAASVWEGCLATPEVPVLASRLGVEENRLGTLLTEEGLVADHHADCVPYVAATGGEDGVASAAFQRTEPKSGEAPIVALRKTANGITTTPGACDCPSAERRVLTLPVQDMMNVSGEESTEAEDDQIPANIRWQLGILVPQMVSRLVQQTGSDSATSTEPDVDTHTVRVTLERETDLASERLRSVELIETASGKRVDGAWWLERPNGPGVFIGMEGVSYERLLWQSPVRYVYKSRGVGPAAPRSVQQRVAPPKGSRIKTAIVRTLRLGGFHLGVDLMAPKGVDVHAVGDATVAFAGRQGGFGNLVILDHGLGYQTYYAHLSKIKPEIKAGRSVPRGEIIGLVGSTGHSTGPHLHFEARKDSKYFDLFDESREPEFWKLSADDQERLAMQLLTPSAANSNQRVFSTPEKVAVRKSSDGTSSNGSAQ
jgi:murein DD-endopeptidase MepM/ murein hydrolase activator NlpD